MTRDETIDAWLASLPICRERIHVEEDLAALRKIRASSRNRVAKHRDVRVYVPVKESTPVKDMSTRVKQLTKASSADIEAVITYYVSKRPNRTPGTVERAKVACRLREGFTVEKLKEAIDGCLARPYTNDQGKTFDSLELIVRNSAKVEQYRAAPKTPIPKPHETPYGQGIDHLQKKGYSPWR